ncbi:16S rRNA (guanine(527)-N(7))-methyltransferase RsmG [Ponticaulis koreensis]|uniref:16S rRNA (guanine(527)-N(7))-methyltransferase RsmG n=1 Tax=Ponticaulis koreensis TaxID=1123045 RepID=UPI0003B38C3E|nr:16S rRNA (guanine(527)-N(7))-methyltransferase RsmG [Ponticaulis koreensis]
MTYEKFLDRIGFDVSRETFEKLCRYHDLLLLWSKTHNLIGPRERSELWDRHFVDCIQVWPLVREGRVILDIGTGAGLPGIVMACCADPEVHEIVLVESLSKRCAFLRTVVRELDLPATIENSRVEDVSRETVNFVTARAVTDLTGLIQYSEKWLKNSAVGVFLKGKNWKTELTEAQSYWTFKSDVTPSVSDSDGVIFSVSEVRRV